MGGRRPLAALALLALLLPLALAQGGSLQDRLDAAPDGLPLRLDAATYSGPATLARPLAVEGVDHQTRLVAPGGTALRLDADGASVRFVIFDEASVGLAVAAGRTALAGPAQFLGLTTGIALEEGATLLLNNDPTIPVATSFAADSRLLFTRPARVDGTDASTGAAIAGIQTTLVAPDGRALLARPQSYDAPFWLRDGAGSREPDGYAIRVSAPGYEDVTLPWNEAQARVTLSMSPKPAPTPAPTQAQSPTPSPAATPAPTSAQEPVPEPTSDPVANEPTGGGAAGSGATGDAGQPTIDPASPSDPASASTPGVVEEEPLEQQSIEAPASAEPEPPITPVEVAAAAAVTATTLSAAAGGGALLIRSERRLWKLLLALAPLYTRLKRSELLASPAREKLLAHVRENPGVRYRELQRALALPNGALAHHLRILLREKLIEETREGHAVRFSVPGARPTTPSDTTERVLAFVRANPGATGAAVAKALDLTASLAGYHLQKLADEGRVDRRREGVRVRAYPLTQA